MSMMHLSNLLVPAMMFSALGLFAQLIRSDLKFRCDHFYIELRCITLASCLSLTRLNKR